ncbi:hypothetical protein Dda_7705 [Drechslerella dactyloides]|uniref:Phosphoglycerate mutase n=1 Tax=Drechslerella dactyloides TaxID=74499 RepID=A0AAD6ISN2_DREDA|nr:hypothetical protein Dda_7705 [Drechslerella dactyloides]
MDIPRWAVHPHQIFPKLDPALDEAANPIRSPQVEHNHIHQHSPAMEYLVSGRDEIFDYSVERGLFAQSLPEYLIDHDEFNNRYHEKNFGLMLFNSKDEPDWHALVKKVSELNEHAAPDETYKVFYLARHVEHYGQEEWNKRISLLKEYDGLRLGPDPDLTPVGIDEAAVINKIWKDQIHKYGLSHAGALPQKFYASPFTRALRTLEVTWKDLVLHLPDAPRVTVRENLRETIGRHWCDMRGSMPEVKQEFKFIDVEDGMSDEDNIWTDRREDESPGGSMDRRLRDTIDDIFLRDGETFISITAHSGCLRSILRITGHRIFHLTTSVMIPIIVKAKLRPDYKDKIKFPQPVSGLPYNFEHPPTDDGKPKD